MDEKEFYPGQDKKDGILTAIITGFVAGVTATITMFKLVR